MEMPKSEDPLLPGNSANAPTKPVDRYFRFWFLVCGIMFFFGVHNFLQEKIMTLPGFKVREKSRFSMEYNEINIADSFQVGVFLGYLEVLGVTVCASIERTVLGETTRRAPWSSYGMLCFCLLISSATSNIALSYINYPTKVVFRSCKVRFQSISLANISSCLKLRAM
jgi:adenosine 3'-phospho 5'-phosphosulfate transporter B3